LGGLFTITASLNGVASLQLFIPSHGGNGTQYVCEYSRDGVDTYASKCAVSKLAYVGLHGPEAMNSSDAAVALAEEPQALPCNFRRLNEELSGATRRLVRCCEQNARCRVMACTARFVVDPRGVAWFVGAKNVVTLPRPPRETRASTVIPQPPPPAEPPTPARSPLLSRVSLLRRTSTLSAIHSDVTDSPGPCEGDYCRQPPVPSPGRGAAHADVDFVTGASKLLPAADASTPALGFHSIAHRTILLDRALQRRGVGLGLAAPEEALRLFLAEERRSPAAHARQASVCDRCVCYYELFHSRRRVEEREVRRAMRAEAEAAAAKAAIQAAAAAEAARAAEDAMEAAGAARGKFSIYRTENDRRGSHAARARGHLAVKHLAVKHLAVKDGRGGTGQMRGSQSTPALHSGPFGLGGADSTGRDPARTSAQAISGDAPVGRDSQQGPRMPAPVAGSPGAMGGSAGLAQAYDAARGRQGGWLPAVGGGGGGGAELLGSGRRTFSCWQGGRRARAWHSRPDGARPGDAADGTGVRITSGTWQRGERGGEVEAAPGGGRRCAGQDVSEGEGRPWGRYCRVGARRARLTRSAMN
jgi:hypothetical protein